MNAGDGPELRPKAQLCGRSMSDRVWSWAGHRAWSRLFSRVCHRTHILFNFLEHNLGTSGSYVKSETIRVSFLKWVRGSQAHSTPFPCWCRAGVSNLRCAGRVPPRMAVNAAQHKIVNVFRTLWDIFVITCHNVFNVWPKTTFLPVWPRDTKMLDTPGREFPSRSCEPRSLSRWKAIWSLFLRGNSPSVSEYGLPCAKLHPLTTSGGSSGRNWSTGS